MSFQDSGLSKDSEALELTCPKITRFGKLSTLFHGSIVAMMVLAEGWIEQLYVAPDWRGRGLGDRLVALAKGRQPAGLQLWTFQVNGPARRFYERHGFRVVELTDGRGNEELEPDVRYAWRPPAERS